MDKCLIGKSVDEIVNYLDMYFTLPQPDYKGSSMLGLRAAWYLDSEMPLYRGSDHAVVFSVECDWQEEEELISRLKPVDFARKGKVMVFSYLQGRQQRLFGIVPGGAVERLSAAGSAVTQTVAGADLEARPVMGTA
jgi:hypothetical protein